MITKIKTQTVKKKCAVSEQDQGTVSTSSTPHAWPFDKKTEPIFASIIFCKSRGVWRLSAGVDRSAVVIKLNKESTSSCVWPTRRWAIHVLENVPVWAKLASAREAYPFLNSFTVLSHCTHSLVAGRDWGEKIKQLVHGHVKLQTSNWIRSSHSVGNGEFWALVLIQIFSNERIT